MYHRTIYRQVFQGVPLTVWLAHHLGLCHEDIFPSPYLAVPAFHLQGVLVCHRQTDRAFRHTGVSVSHHQPASVGHRPAFQEICWLDALSPLSSFGSVQRDFQDVSYLGIHNQAVPWKVSAETGPQETYRPDVLGFQHQDAVDDR